MADKGAANIAQEAKQTTIEFDKSRKILDKLNKQLSDAKESLRSGNKLSADQTKQIQLQVDSYKKNIAQQENLAKKMKEKSSELAKQRKMELEILDVTSKMGNKLKGDAKVYEQILAEKKVHYGLQSSIDKLEERSSDALEHDSVLLDYRKSTLESIQDVVGENLKVLKDTLEMSKSIGTEEFTRLDLSEKYLELETKKAEIEAKRSVLGPKYTKDALMALDISKSQLDSAAELNKRQDRQNMLITGTLAPLTKISEKVQEISKYGEGFLTGLGAGKLGSGLTKVTEKFRNDLVKAHQEGGSAGQVAMKSVGAGAKALAGLLKPAILFGGVLLVVGLIFEAIKGIDDEVSEMGKRLGISKKEAIAVHHAAADMAISMNLVGVNVREVEEGLMAVEEGLGGIDVTTLFSRPNKEVQEMVRSATILTQSMGLSNDEAAGLAQVSAITGKSMDEVAQQTVEMGKGIFASKEALKAVANVSKDVVFNFKGNIQALAKAAIQAKALGITLKEVKDIGRGTLDIESSLQDEMEARVITGRDINLDAMRYAALTGDVQGQMDELVKGLGSAADFQKMAPLQQESLAKAYGMSVDKVAEMLGKQEELKKAHLSYNEVQKMQGMKAEELLKVARETGDVEKAHYLEKMAKEKESASITERFGDIWKKVQDQLMKVVTPLLEMLETLLESGDATSAISDVFSTVSGIISGIAPILKLVLSLIMPVLKSAMGMTSAITGLFGSTGKSADEAEKQVQKTGEAVKNNAGIVVEKTKAVTSGFGALQGGMLAMVGGGLLFKNVIGSAFSVAKDGAMGLLGKLNPISAVTKKVSENMAGKGGFLGKMSEKMGAAKAPKLPAADMAGGGKGFLSKIKDFVNEVKPANILAVAAAMLIMAAALWVTAKAFQEFGKVSWDGVLKGIVAMGLLVGAAYLISKIEGEILQGALALLVLSGAMLVSALGFKIFSEVSWEGVLKGIVAVGAVALMAVLLGSVAPMALLGAAALLIMGGAVIAFGYGVKLLSESLEKAGPVIVAVINAIGDNVTKFLKQLSELGNLDPVRVAAISVSLLGLGAAIAGFSALVSGGSIMKGLGEGIGKLFGSQSPIESIMALTQKNDPSKIISLANGIKQLADALMYFGDATSKLSGVDTDKLSKIIDSINSASGNTIGQQVGSSIKSVANSISGVIGSVFGGGDQGSDKQASGATSVSNTGGGGNDTNSKIVALLEQLVSSVQSQPVQIKFDDKVITEFKTQMAFKKQYNIGVDNSYGGAIPSH